MSATDLANDDDDDNYVIIIFIAMIIIIISIKINTTTNYFSVKEITIICNADSERTVDLSQVTQIC